MSVRCQTATFRARLEMKEATNLPLLNQWHRALKIRHTWHSRPMEEPTTASKADIQEFGSTKRKTPGQCPGLCYRSGSPSSVDGEQIAYATHNGVNRLLAIEGSGKPEAVVEREGIRVELVVQIFDAKNPARAGILRDLVIHAGAGYPAKD